MRKTTVAQIQHLVQNLRGSWSGSQIVMAGGSQTHTAQPPASPQAGGPQSPASASRPMVPYQLQEGTQHAPLAPQPTVGQTVHTGGHQQQVPVQPHMVSQHQPPEQQPQLVIPQQGNGLQGIDWTNKIADVMRSQLGLKPKVPVYTYRRSYPEAYDQVTLSHRYRVPDFTKFSGQDTMSTTEHVSKFLEQCEEASRNDALKIRLFPLSLSGSAFAWFSLLVANSIIMWADLVKQFHKYFFAGVQEMKIMDLTIVKQRNGE